MVQDKGAVFIGVGLAAAQTDAVLRGTENTTNDISGCRVKTVTFITTTILITWEIISHVDMCHTFSVSPSA